MDIAGWLSGLGLERYEQAFRDNAIDEKILPMLTADDLKDIGVTVVGHRRKMLEAIAVLNAGDERAIPSATESKIALEPIPQSALSSIQAEQRQLTVLEARSLGQSNPQLCVDLLNGRLSGDIRPFIPDDLERQEMAVMEKLIVAVAER